MSSPSWRSMLQKNRPLVTYWLGACFSDATPPTYSACSSMRLAQNGSQPKPHSSTPIRKLGYRSKIPPPIKDPTNRIAPQGREAPTKIRHVPVIGAGHPDFERGVREADDAEPRAGDQKVNIGPLVIHVLDAVLGLIVLHPW